MNTIKSIFNSIDLYGNDVLITAIKQKYEYISYTKNGKTLPKDGSRCFQTSKLTVQNDVKFTKLIEHKNGAITLKTEQGYLVIFLNF